VVIRVRDARGEERSTVVRAELIGDLPLAVIFSHYPEFHLDEPGPLTTAELWLGALDAAGRHRTWEEELTRTKLELPSASIDTLASRWRVNGNDIAEVVQALHPAKSGEAAPELQRRLEELLIAHLDRGTWGIGRCAEPRLALSNLALDAQTRDAVTTLVAEMASYLDAPRPRQSVSPILPQNALCLIEGPPGSGRSTLARSLSRELGTRLRWIGREALSDDKLRVDSSQLQKALNSAWANGGVVAVEETELIPAPEPAEFTTDEQYLTHRRRQELHRAVLKFPGLILFISEEEAAPELRAQALWRLQLERPNPQVRGQLWDQALTRQGLTLSAAGLSRLAQLPRITGEEIRQTVLKAYVEGALKEKSEDNALEQLERIAWQSAQAASNDGSATP